MSSSRMPLMDYMHIFQFIFLFRNDFQCTVTENSNSQNCRNDKATFQSVFLLNEQEKRLEILMACNNEIINVLVSLSIVSVD